MGDGLLHHRQGGQLSRVRLGQGHLGSVAPGLPGRAGGSQPRGRGGGLGKLLPAGKGSCCPGPAARSTCGFLCGWSGSHGGPGSLGRDLLPAGAVGLEPAAVPSLRPGHGVGLGKCLLNRCPEGADAVVRPADCTEHSIAWSPRPSIWGVSCSPTHGFGEQRAAGDTAHR